MLGGGDLLVHRPKGETELSVEVVRSPVAGVG